MTPARGVVGIDQAMSTTGGNHWISLQAGTSNVPTPDNSGTATANTVTYAQLDALPGNGASPASRG